MSECLEYHYFNNLTRFKTRDALQLSLILTKLNKLLPKNNNNKALTYLFCVWIVIAFNDHNGVANLDKSDFIWFEKYAVVSKLFNILKKFIFKINYHFLQKNDVIILDEDVILKELMWSILYVLVNSFIITEIEWKVKDKTDGFRYKSNIFLSFQNNLIFFNNQYNIKLYLNPLNNKQIINNKYVVGDHYLTSEPLIKKNKYSPINSQLQNHSFLIERGNMRLYIRWSLFFFLKDLLFTHYKLDLSTAAEDLSKILSDKKKKFWSKNYQREFSHLFSLSYFLKVAELQEFLKGGFYFRYYFDFRGRLYADSPISYTHNRYFRFVYHYGFYMPDELDNFRGSIEYDDYKYADLILDNTNIRTKYTNLNLNDKLILYYLQLVFFEIGKVFKSGVSETCGGRIQYRQFIDVGINFYNGGSLAQSKLEHQVEYWSIIFILEEINSGIFIKVPIFHDATASGLQILTLLLGAKTPEVYLKSNFLDREVWYDTYYFIINEFLKTECVPEIFKQYFSRTVLKKTIMTFNYKASYIKCWEEFKNSTMINNREDGVVQKEVGKYFHKFFKYLKKIFETQYYFKNPPIIITQHFNAQFSMENYWYSTNDNFDVFLKYYLFDILKRSDRLIPGEQKRRKTSEWLGLSEKYDSRKTLRAVQANFVHAIDAYLLRLFFKKFTLSTITIHDSIGVPILKIKDFKWAIANTMQQIYNENPLNVDRSFGKKFCITGNFIFL